MQSEIVTLNSLTTHILDNNQDAVKRNLMKMGLVDASFIPDYNSFIALIVGYEKQYKATAQTLADITANALDVPINTRGFGATWLVMVENMNGVKLNTIVRKTAEMQFAAAAKSNSDNPTSQITISNDKEYRNQVIMWVIIILLVLAAIGGFIAFWRGMFKFIKSS